MKVLIFVNYQGNQYEWDNLTEQEKKKMTEKLNQQTADQLGYEKEIIKIDRRTRKKNARGSGSSNRHSKINITVSLYQLTKIVKRLKSPN